MVLMTAFVSLVFFYSLVSRRLEQTVLTAPILFTTAGALVGSSPEVLNALASNRKGALLVAELGLVMTLFADASRIGVGALRGHPNLPVRLLSTGMLLTIMLGALCAMIVLGGLSWWEAGVLAAILAPTDAGLGQVIVKSPRVPQRIRQALNVEAGLNDGLSVPFLMFFVALAVAQQEPVLGSGVLPRFLLEQLGYGSLVGLGVGLVGGWLLGLARGKGWMGRPLAQLGVVALPLACVLACEPLGASMFIAAFVAGLAAQAGFRDVGRHSVEFTEEWGQLINFFVFFLFGLLVASRWTEISVAAVLYGVLSLTLIRMLPVAIALRGAGLHPATVLFMGWFGPRGLGSIVLGLVYLEQQTHPSPGSAIRLTVMMTVMMSILAHGLSAGPGMELYARKISALPPDAPELESAGAESPR